MKYKINNIGCDDTTETIMELTDEELKVLVKFAKLNNENSSYLCQPRIDILSLDTKEYIVNCLEEIGEMNAKHI